ncbi:MAG: hypothetical protein KA757_13270 [Vogesella sp.]|nr:hypothetical protein [Vogesella sp.]
MDIDVKSLEQQTGLTGLSNYEAKYLAKAQSLGVLDVAALQVFRHRQQQVLQRQQADLLRRLAHHFDAIRKLKSPSRSPKCA